MTTTSPERTHRHMVPGDALVNSAEFGVPAVAACGFTWIPDPSPRYDLPSCPECAARMASLPGPELAPRLPALAHFTIHPDGSVTDAQGRLFMAAGKPTRRDRIRARVAALLARVGRRTDPCGWENVGCTTDEPDVPDAFTQRPGRITRQETDQ